MITPEVDQVVAPFVKTVRKKVSEIGSTVKSSARLVKESEITDYNIIQALQENWKVDTEKKESNSSKGHYELSLYERVIAHALNDPRDVSVVNVAIMGIAVQVSSALMFVSQKISWAQIAIHAALLIYVIRRYVLALHVSSHRPLFRKSYSFLNLWIPFFLAPWCGQTPYTYYWHHLKMHHITDNGLEDLSSTLLFQRDNIFHFLYYFFRFYFLVWFELSRFFLKKGQSKAVFHILTSEFVCVGLMTYLFFKVNALAAFMSFILPLNIVRFGMMQGNWVQHSFIERSNPLGGGLRNSITLINCEYNHACFNDGYHASHHLNPRRHFLDHPAELVRNRKVYHDSNAIVFQDESYDSIWFFLMTHNYDHLATKWVHVGEGPAPSHAEIVQKLKEKTLRFSREEIEAAAQPSPDVTIDDD